METDKVVEYNLCNLAKQLFEIDAVKVGNYQTKSGIETPIYFDLRVIVSYPHIVNEIATVLSKMICKEDCDFICGVPYTALSLTSVLSVKSEIPMLLRRKEPKSYGTKKIIEGHFDKGQSCVIIEDVITTGSSVLETVADLRNHGLKVSKAYIILDREQGGYDILKKHGIEVQSLFTMTSLCNMLLDQTKINQDDYDKIMLFLKNNQVGVDIVKGISMVDRTKMTWPERMEKVTNPITKKLFKTIIEKQTTLCVAADLTSTQEILNLVEDIGNEICILKLHVDIIQDFNADFVKHLKILAKSRNFMIMEDRKFSDIGNTVALQFGKGIFKIADFADLITVHSLPGESVLKGIAAAVGDDQIVGVFLLAQMSTEDNLISPEYTEKTLKMATKYPSLVTGIVSQNNVFDNPDWIQLTPGVKLAESADNLGQMYNSPEKVVTLQGCDVAVVGRGIVKAKNRKITAQQYRLELWQAYLERLH